MIEGRPRAHCVACGSVQYEQLKVGAGVLVEQGGNLLLVKRSTEATAFPGAWNLPAGYCEANEDPQSTAVREAGEETGLTVNVGPLVDAYFFDDDPRGNGLLLVYEATLKNGDSLPDPLYMGSTAEVTDSGFFAPDTLPNPLCGGGHDQAIAAWRQRALDRWQPGTEPRYCPHCAHSLEEQFIFGRDRPVCPACGFIHFREQKVGVSVLVERPGEVLLVQRNIEPGLGKWCLPSGFVEWDESPETAAARECLEETGLVVSDLELVSASHYTDDFRGPGINLTYRAHVRDGKLEPGDDAAAARWFGRENLPDFETVAFPNQCLILEQWREE